MFENLKPTNDNERPPEDVENEKKYQEYLQLKESAPADAAAKIAEAIDSSLEGEERHQALVGLMERLNEEDPQGNRLVIELIAEITTLEKLERELDQKKTVYPEAAELVKKAA